VGRTLALVVSADEKAENDTADSGGRRLYAKVMEDGSLQALFVRGREADFDPFSRSNRLATPEMEKTHDQATANRFATLLPKTEGFPWRSLDQLPMPVLR